MVRTDGVDVDGGHGWTGRLISSTIYSLAIAELPCKLSESFYNLLLTIKNYDLPLTVSLVPWTSCTVDGCGIRPNLRVGKLLPLLFSWIALSRCLVPRGQVCWLADHLIYEDRRKRT